MNRFFTLLLAASCLTAVGQVTYPYNPDGNADGDIAVGDLQDFLTVYGNQFEPGIILVDSVELSYLIDSLFQRIFNLEQEQQQTLELLVVVCLMLATTHPPYQFRCLSCVNSLQLVMTVKAILWAIELVTSHSMELSTQPGIMGITVA